MAAWIKMPLGMELGLSPDDFVLDGNPLYPPQKGGRAPSPIFGPLLLWPNGCNACIKMPLGTEVGLSPGDFVLDGDPSHPKFSAQVILVIVISLEHCAQSLLVCSSSS